MLVVVSILSFRNYDFDKNGPNNVQDDKYRMLNYMLTEKKSLLDHKATEL